MRLASRKTATHLPPRTLTATTEIVVSMRRSARRSGERARATTCLTMRMTRVHDDHLGGEELAKERETDSIRYHEEEESSPRFI